MSEAVRAMILASIVLLQNRNTSGEFEILCDLLHSSGFFWTCDSTFDRILAAYHWVAEGRRQMEFRHFRKD
jgi:hypothetical protein